VAQTRRTKDLLSGLFAADHLGQLKSRRSTESMVAAREVLSGALPDRHITVAEFLDAAFSALVKDFPVEYVFKSCALKRILFGRHSPRTTAFYTEFRVGDSRADVLAVNGCAHVYEIKTRYDDLSRLSAQLDDYYRAFTHVTLFVDEAHGSAVAARIPRHTGITTLSNRYSMSVRRPAMPFGEALDSYQLFRLLHEREYVPILNAHGIEPRQVDPARRYKYCLDALDALDVGELQLEVTRALKKRQSTARLAQIAATLPESLRLAPFAYRMTLTDWRTISERMELYV